MKVTDSKDLGKVNQILPIMQEHFGKNMNLARRKLTAYVIHALCVVQTVSLHKLAAAMPTSVERNSNVRRLQRFFAKYTLRFINLFGHGSIDCLVADREFVGNEWIGWLNDNRIRYYIRIRQNFWVVNPKSGEKFE